MEAPVTRPADPYPTSYPKSHIDQDRADNKLETLRDRITSRVNGERPEGRRGHRRRGGK